LALKGQPCRSARVSAVCWPAWRGSARRTPDARLPWAWQRAGGMAVAALAPFHLNGIAGDPYKTLTLALTGKMTATAMAAFCALKLASTVSSYSSGGSGGIFAPALFMGAMLGGAVGHLDVIVFHHSADS